ncbi:MAG TPA: tetratricopeptide repeat protein [Thermoanaerobaculia bacterium]
MPKEIIRPLSLIAGVIVLFSLSSGRSLVSADEPVVPKEAQELLGRANLKENAGDFRGAAAIYDQILTPATLKTPKQKQAALYKKAQAEVELQSYEVAVKDFTQTLALVYAEKKLSLELAQVYYERGYVYDAQGRLDKAIADYTMCLEIDPGHSRAYNNRAVANYKTGRFREAITDAESYLAIDPNRAEAYFVRGISRVSLKDRSGIDDLKIAARMGHPLAKEALQKAGINADHSPLEAKPAVTFDLLRQRAESGDSAAQFVAAAYLVHTSGDLVEARKWYQKAAMQNHPMAQLQFGRMFQWGKGGVRSDAEALGWFLKAAGQGVAAAQNEAALMYVNGEGIPANFPEAFKLFTQAADQKYGPSYAELGLMYLHGEGTPVNAAKALTYFSRGADEGDPDCAERMGWRYFNGEGVTKDYTAAAKWFRQAGEAGQAQAQSQLAFMYLNGTGVEQNDRTAFEWYEKAASGGDPEASKNLGILYLTGKGTPRSMDRAKYWLQQAAGQGNRQATGILEQLRKSGNG